MEQILLFLCPKSHGKGVKNPQVGPVRKTVLLKLGKERTKKKWTSFLCMKVSRGKMLKKSCFIWCHLSFFMDKTL